MKRLEPGRNCFVSSRKTLRFSWLKTRRWLADLWARSTRGSRASSLPDLLDLSVKLWDVLFTYCLTCCRHDQYSSMMLIPYHLYIYIHHISYNTLIIIYFVFNSNNVSIIFYYSKKQNMLHHVPPFFQFWNHPSPTPTFGAPVALFAVLLELSGRSVGRCGICGRLFVWTCDIKLKGQGFGFYDILWYLIDILWYFMIVIDSLFCFVMFYDDFMFCIYICLTTKNIKLMYKV